MPEGFMVEAICPSIPGASFLIVLIRIVLFIFSSQMLLNERQPSWAHSFGFVTQQSCTLPPGSGFFFFLFLFWQQPSSSERNNRANVLQVGFIRVRPGTLVLALHNYHVTKRRERGKRLHTTTGRRGWLYTPSPLARTHARKRKWEKKKSI